MDNRRMDLRRLHLLLELSRLGSMRAVADAHRLTTSTVSQQIAALAREAGTPLVEPEGRRVRLTPAGRRLADHAVTILAAVDAARLDLDPESEPAGQLRIGGFATAVRASLLPIARTLEDEHAGVEVLVHEYEPVEALALLLDDDLDLALTYDYNLAPCAPDPLLEARRLWSSPWGLGVPAVDAPPSRVADLAAWADRPWIVNSRNIADEAAVRTLGSLVGIAPVIRHHIDSLELVEDLIVSGYGVGLLPLDRPTVPGVRVLRLEDPPVVLTAYAVTRRGRERWSPLRLLLDRLVDASGRSQPYLPVVSRA
jgi:DNA-binding transcriptional LysR family regulator